MTWLSAWENFYVILGSSAAALAGLMFVVTALIVDHRGTEQQLEAFGTPTVVHFGAAPREHDFTVIVVEPDAAPAAKGDERRTNVTRDQPSGDLCRGLDGRLAAVPPGKEHLQTREAP